MRGFTLIELLIVLGVSGIFVAISAGVYTSLRQRSSLELAVREVQSVFQLAREQTLSSEGAQNFGVYVNSAGREYFLFPGSSYVAGNPDNERFVVPANVNILTPEFQGGGSEMVFDRLTGMTSQFGTLTVQDAGDISRMLRLCVFSSGSVEVISSAQCGDAPLEHIGTTDVDLANFPGRWGDPAQSFTVGAQDMYVREAQLYLRRITAAPSDIYLEIRGTSTAGPIIGAGRSRIIQGSSLPASLGWISFTFPAPVFLQASTQYFLRLRSLADSTVYDPFNPSFSATGTIHWGYTHSASVPPAYAGGDAWRYVEYIAYGGAGATGQQLGPADQYDFAFRLIYGIDPPAGADSRHVEFELDDPTNSNHDGWSIRGGTTLTLTFTDPTPDVVQNIAMASYFNSDQTVFDWQGSVNVDGDTETLRIHSLYIDRYDTVLSVHRDRAINNKAVDISIDGRLVASYAADGTIIVGAYGGEAVYR